MIMPARNWRSDEEHVSALGVALSVWLLALPASAQVSATGAADNISLASNSAYQLIDASFGAIRSSQQLGQQRLEATTAIAPRHELRFSAWATGRGGLDSLPGVSLATLTSDPALRLDPARATYRYTVLTQRDWAWKLGISANVRELGDSLRPGLATPERLRFGSLPLLHVAGGGQLATRWHLAFDADGLMTPRGRTFDLGLRVNYSLTPHFLLFGGYRMTEAAGDAEEPYGTGLSNAANFGVRYRF
jgi:hypothetical protein